MNILWAKLIVEELYRNGVHYFCIAPGSRSSPLAVAMGEHPKIKTFIHYDERGLSFHALGYTAATKEPSVILTTSGTAVANLLPAVVEASKKKLALIILTADRPPELRQTGAMQTIDQVGIFGSFTRWHFDLPCPTETIEPAFVLTTIDQAIHRSKGCPSGPVHLNCMFREPLAPTKTEESFSSYLESLELWKENDKPYTQYVTSEPSLRQEQIETIISGIRKIKKGVIVVGKLANAQEGKTVLRLSKRLNWPVFPDISSGLRLGNKHKNVIHYYDQILLNPKLLEMSPFDGVLHLGGRITSKRWYEYIETLRPAHTLMVLKHPLRSDPLHNVTLRVESDVTEFCKTILGESLPQRRRRDILHLKNISLGIDRAVTGFMTKRRGLNEPDVARLISQHIPKQTALFLANSMPIRYMDMFASPKHHPVTVEGNRGASGIDGNLAAAAGFAEGFKKPVTLLVGDLALLHDLNSLAILKNIQSQVVIVVLNNNGGGIFSFLPIAQFPGLFEKYFATPHDLQFQLAARMFGIHYAQPKTQNQFVAEYHMAFVRKKPTILEINIDRHTSFTVTQSLEQHISSSVKTIKQGQRLLLKRRRGQE